MPLIPDAVALMRGEERLTSDDATELATLLARQPGFRDDSPLFRHPVKELSWSARFPGVDSIMAFPIQEIAPFGWLIASNKKGADGPAAFRRSDAALMLPFVALARLQVGATHRFDEFKELVVGLARSLTTVLDAKDSYTYGHSERVARISIELGRNMGLQGDELNDIYLAGLLHDVGKIGVPDAILGKKGKAHRGGVRGDQAARDDRLHDPGRPACDPQPVCRACCTITSAGTAWAIRRA